MQVFGWITDKRLLCIYPTTNRLPMEIRNGFAGIVGGEASRSMSLLKRSSRRLSWLSKGHFAQTQRD